MPKSLIEVVTCRAAHVPLFLYPFLNTSSKTRPFEYLRLTSLGVIGALVKVHVLHCSLCLTKLTPLHLHWQNDTTCFLQVDDTEVINFLLSTEIIPLCLRTMEMGSELSKTVATFIVQKILLDNVRDTLTMSRAESGGYVWNQPSHLSMLVCCRLV